MKAIVYSKYGGPEQLQEMEVDVPKPAADEVLIKVCAISVNGSDWEGLTGTPLYARIGGLFKPGWPILGSDMTHLAQLCESGSLTPVIDRCYKLSETP